MSDNPYAKVLNYFDQQLALASGYCCLAGARAKGHCPWHKPGGFRVDETILDYSEGNRYAQMRWDQRWNDSTEGPDVSSQQEDNKLLLVTVMGLIEFDLTDDAGLAIYVRMLRSTIDHLMEKKTEFDNGNSPSDSGVQEAGS